MQLLFTVLLKGTSRAQTGQNKSDRSTLHRSCVVHALWLPSLRKQQSGFFQGLRVKGLLWLRARLMTGNIELWISSGIYHLTLLNVPVCSSVDGMWEIMCTCDCISHSRRFCLHTLLGFFKLIDLFIYLGRILNILCIISLSQVVWFTLFSFWT